MPLLKYSAIRLLLLLVCVAGLQFVMGGWLLLLVAVVIAAAVSYLALGRFRDDSAAYLAGLAARRAAGVNSPGTDDEDEDREADVIARQSTPSKPQPGIINTRDSTN